MATVRSAIHLSADGLGVLGAPLPQVGTQRCWWWWPQVVLVGFKCHLRNWTTRVGHRTAFQQRVVLRRDLIRASTIHPAPAPSLPRLVMDKGPNAMQGLGVCKGRAALQRLKRPPLPPRQAVHGQGPQAALPGLGGDARGGAAEVRGCRVGQFRSLPIGTSVWES